MDSLIKALQECFTGEADPPYKPIQQLKEKANNKCYPEKADHSSDQQIASDFVDALFRAEKPGRDLERSLEDIVKTTSWSENLAVAILNLIEITVKKAIPMGQAMKEAFDKATTAAVGFARDHPVYCTLIALGILVILAPYVIQWLGFAELGPLEGSFAASWQARYAGYVPKGSLFSFFQRLGMTWGK